VVSGFKERLRAGGPVIVMNPDHPSPSLVEFIGKLGVDAVMIDTEQGSPDVESVENMARAARVAGITALVRIFSPEAWVIERYLFRGVHGLVVPRLDNADQARKVVDAVRYCFPRNHEEKTIVVQIETAEAVADLDRFLAIDGIDCFFIGSVDLSKSLGHAGDYHHPAVQKVLANTVERIVAAGRAAGMMVKEADVAEWRRRGVAFHYTHLNEFAELGARAFRQLLLG
jgi:2-keto-3-deoxy-L-rhamnonate aldolase RhmA